jgi:purine nucleoside phosphorylase
MVAQHTQIEETRPMFDRIFARQSRRPETCRRPQMETVEERMLLSGIVGQHIGMAVATPAIVGQHIGTNVATDAIQGNHIGTNVATDAIQGNHIGMAAMVTPSVVFRKH